METTFPKYSHRTRNAGDEIRRTIREIATPLRHAEDLDPLMDRIGNARVVLLGEASHGTSEFYVWRYAITRRLIEEKGFSFIGVEGDWPDCYQINRFVKGYPDSGTAAHDVLLAFNRWPTWMWANWEVVHLTEWLRRHNASKADAEKAGFYGLDVYSLWDSMAAVIRYLEGVDPEAADNARRAYGCFDPYREDAQDYAWATALALQTCEDDVVGMLRTLRERMPDYPDGDAESKLNAEQNAIVARNAELYYRTMIRSGPVSWNVRDRHMFESLERLRAHHGPGAKAVVWEHNTHIGDARATDMTRAGMFNIGQLAREEHGGDAVLVGFGSYRGHVIAAGAWGSPMTRMAMPEAREGSWEELLHGEGMGDNLMVFDAPRLPESFHESRGHRAIGVVYDPDREELGNYVATVLPRRYDAFVFIDESRALHPIHMVPRPSLEFPETYPTAV
jgi:erythromycin esterase